MDVHRPHVVSPGTDIHNHHELVLPSLKLSEYEGDLVVGTHSTTSNQQSVHNAITNSNDPRQSDKDALIAGLGSEIITTPNLSTESSNTEGTGPTSPRSLHEYVQARALLIGTAGAEFPTSPSDNFEYAHSRSSYAEGSLVIGLQGARFVTPAPPQADSLAQLHRHAEQEIERNRGLQRATLESQTEEDRGLGEMEVGKTFSDKMFTWQSSDSVSPHDSEPVEIMLPRK